jgi:peptide deformylase
MAEIVCVPHPVLRQIAKPVDRVDQKLLDIITTMTQALLAAKDPEGVGLAAPQIGIPLRIFLARPDPTQPPLLFINPEITRYSQRQQKPDTKNGVYEGCLSIPHHYSPIKRSMSVTVKYQTLSFLSSRLKRSEMEGSLDFARDDKLELVEKTENFTGFAAHIIQHEVDHLNGILFVDHVLSQNSKLYLIQGKVWEEVSI